MPDTTQEMEDLLYKAWMFQFVTGPLTMAMRAAFAAYYSHADMDSEGGTLTLRECRPRRKPTKNVLLKNKKSLNDFFGGQTAKEVKDCVILDANLDIKFYHTAITQFCHSVYEKYSSAKTMQLLDEAKKERNKLAHKNFKNQSSIEHALSALKALCQDLIDNVEKDLGGCHMTKVRPSIEKLAIRISNKKPDIKQYKKNQLNFFKDFRNKFVRDSQAHLQNEGELGSVVDPFIKLIRQIYPNRGAQYTISDVFTPPLMLSNEKIVLFKKVLTTVNEKGIIPMAVVVSGQGGCGKSTLCRVIFDLWRKNSSQQTAIEELNSKDLILYIELKHTMCEKLEDYLRNEYLVNQMKDINKNEVSELFVGLNVLVFLDGYDEKKRNGDKLISDILATLPECRLIITTRPEYLSDLEEAISTVTRMTLILEGFEESERSKFAGNVFRLVEKDEKIRKGRVKQYNEYLKGRASCLREHLKLPLTMALLTFLWLENVNNLKVINSINTATQLYSQLFEMLKEKLIKVRTNFRAEDNLGGVIDLLRGKAFDQLKAGQLLTLTENNEREIKKACKNDTNATEVLSCFLIYDVPEHTGSKKKKNPPTVRHSFFHRSQMEYYSACFISDDFLNSDTNFMKYFDQRDRRKYREILPFLAGRLKLIGKLTEHCSGLLNLCKAMGIDETDFDFWFKLLHETESKDDSDSEPHYDKTMSSTIVSYLPAKSWSLIGLPVKTIISALNLLTHCPSIHIDDLIIHFPNKEGLNNNRDLKFTLQQLGYARSNLQRQPKPKLELNFFGYDKDDTNYLSDPLEYFGSWCEVIEFKGRLQENSVKHLQHGRIVTVKVTKLATFNEIAVQSASMRDMKRLHLQVFFSVGEIHSENLKRITQNKGKTDITFLKLIDNDVQKTIAFVLDTYPEAAGGFYTVTMKGRLTYDDGKEILERFVNEVREKVCIESDVLSDSESRALTSKARELCSAFRLDWNNEKIY